MSESPPTPSVAIMKAHAELREAGRAVRESRARMQDATAHHEELSAHLNKASTDQEAMERDYQRLLHGVLCVLDDCAHVLRGNPEIAVVHDGLCGLLHEQGVEVMPTVTGQPFDAELHESCEVVSATNLPHGAIIDIVTPGYIRRSGDTTVVVRPAIVRVSGTPGTR